MQGALAVETQGLKRSFGKVRAIDGLDLEVPAGDVIALVGPNGAGKTTLLLILAALLAPDDGTALVGGKDVVSQPYEVHGAIGWMPDFFGVYDGLTALEYLEFFAAAYRLPASARNGRARELLSLVGIEEFGERPVHVLSRGQKQRLGLARALVHEPSVLLLDEPASGLDPKARIDLRRLIRQQRDAGVSVIVSSHILSELQEMSDSVVFMSEGRSRGYHRIDDLPTSIRRVWRVRALDPDRLDRALESALVIEREAGGSFKVELGDEKSAAELVTRLVAEGIQLVEMTPLGGGLEAAFMGLDEGTRT